MFADRKKILRIPNVIENITIRKIKTRSTRWSIITSPLHLLLLYKKNILESIAFIEPYNPNTGYEVTEQKKTEPTPPAGSASLFQMGSLTVDEQNQ